MEFIIELLGEILIEVYGEAMMLIVPENKRNKRLYTLSKVLAIAVLILSLAAVITGVILIENGASALGIALIISAATISLIQIILGIIFYKKNHPKKKGPTE